MHQKRVGLAQIIGNVDDGIDRIRPLVILIPGPADLRDLVGIHLNAADLQCQAGGRIGHENPGGDIFHRVEIGLVHGLRLRGQIGDGARCTGRALIDAKTDRQLESGDVKRQQQRKDDGELDGANALLVLLQPFEGLPQCAQGAF